MGSLALLQCFTHHWFISLLSTGKWASTLKLWNPRLCIALTKKCIFFGVQHQYLLSPPSASACASLPQQHASSPLLTYAPRVSSCVRAVAVHSTAWPASPAPTCSVPVRLRKNNTTGNWGQSTICALWIALPQETHIPSNFICSSLLSRAAFSLLSIFGPLPTRMPKWYFALTGTIMTTNNYINH